MVQVTLSGKLYLHARTQTGFTVNKYLIFLKHYIRNRCTACINNTVSHSRQAAFLLKTGLLNDSYSYLSCPYHPNTFKNMICIKVDLKKH
jgi:hypothetical protein